MKTFYEMIELMEADQEMALGNQVGSSNFDQGAVKTTDQGQDAGDVDAQAPRDMSQDQEKPKHYMFFSNLKVIKEKVEAMLAMDPMQVDAMLGDGHDWASDHIATSKDDVEEVYNWLAGEVGPSVSGEKTP